MWIFKRQTLQFSLKIAYLLLIIARLSVIACTDFFPCLFHVCFTLWCVALVMFRICHCVSGSAILTFCWAGVSTFGLRPAHLPCSVAELAQTVVPAHIGDRWVGEGLAEFRQCGGVGRARVVVERKWNGWGRWCLEKGWGEVGRGQLPIPSLLGPNPWC